MTERHFNVLFLCTGNSARSIMAEAILNKLGAGKFRAFSAGSQPKGQLHPETLRLLQSLGYDSASFRSKSWHEFAKPGAPSLDFVFTVCDNAAGEACPLWPGQPMTAHWGVPDPAAATGNPAEVALAFKDRLPHAASAHRCLRSVAAWLARSAQLAKQAARDRQHKGRGRRVHDGSEMNDTPSLLCRRSAGDPRTSAATAPSVTFRNRATAGFTPGDRA